MHILYVEKTLHERSSFLPPVLKQGGWNFLYRLLIWMPAPEGSMIFCPMQVRPIKFSQWKFANHQVCQNMQVRQLV